MYRLIQTVLQLYLIITIHLLEISAAPVAYSAPNQVASVLSFPS